MYGPSIGVVPAYTRYRLEAEAREMKAIPSRAHTPHETTMAKLARFGFGRVLLHPIAMLGDRAVRFHCAGTMRELSWLAEARKLPGRVATHFIGALVLYLAKPVNHASRSTTADLQSLSAILRRGDVLLTEGNTRMATLVKRITRSSWSHVSIVCGPARRGTESAVHRRSGRCCRC